MGRFDEGETLPLRRSVQTEGDGTTDETNNDEERAGTTSNRHYNHELDDADGSSDTENDARVIALRPRRQIKPKNAVDYIVEYKEDFQAIGRGALLGLSLLFCFILAFLAVQYAYGESGAQNLFTNTNHQKYTRSTNPIGIEEVPKRINNKDDCENRTSNGKDKSKTIQDSMDLQEDFQDLEGKAAEQAENDGFYNAELNNPNNNLVDGDSMEIEATSRIDNDKYMEKKVKDGDSILSDKGLDIMQEFHDLEGKAAEEGNDGFNNAGLLNTNELGEEPSIETETASQIDKGKHIEKKAKYSDNFLSEKGFRNATNANCPRIIPRPQIATTPLKDPSDLDHAKKGVYRHGVSMEEDPFEIGKANDFTWYSQPTTAECDVSPPPENAACSCWNMSASCCERSIHPNHKWGHHLLAEWFGPQSDYSFGGDVFESSANTAGQRRQFRYPPEYFHRPGGVDYREVFFTRNFYESLVSGYLYHKTGHECWLTGFGKPYAQTRPTKKTFSDSLVQFPEPFPPSNHRSICQYLVDETEWEGMRVYAEYVMRWYYYTTINLYKAVQIHEDPIYRKTLFLCFEDLNSSNATIKGNVLKRIVKFFYPGGQHDDITLPEAKEYTGNHATSHELTQRKRLNDIARQLDEQVFHGVFANLNKMFGNCGENDDR